MDIMATQALIGAGIYDSDYSYTPTPKSHSRPWSEKERHRVGMTVEDPRKPKNRTLLTRNSETFLYW